MLRSIPTDKLINNFPRVYDFCKGDLINFVFLLRKGVYLYEDMDIWEKFDEISLPPKKACYSKLNLKDITDKDYVHGQRVWEEFKIKSCCEYHDLYVQSDTLLLADVFENIENKFIEIYGLDPAHFVCATGLVW